MGKLEELEARLAAIEDVEAIKELKYRYWRCLDRKLWDEMAECFTFDATVKYGEGKYSFAGRDAIMKFLREAMGPDSGFVGVHQGHHPEIELTGATTARGTWSLYNYVLFTKSGRGHREAAYYEDEYAKQDGVWRIRHTGYTYLFCEEWDRGDTRSLKLLAP